MNHGICDTRQALQRCRLVKIACDLTYPNCGQVGIALTH